MTEQFVVGIVHGAHGVNGEFKVESTSGEYGHFAGMEEVTLTDGTEKKTFRVEYTHDASVTLYMKLAGINTAQEAARLNRWQIVVPRKNARPLQQGEWYFEDLKGCSLWYGGTGRENGEAAGNTAPATIPQGTVVGTVTDVMEGGAGYLLEVSLSEASGLLADDVVLTKAGKPRVVYVPFREQFIGEVDVERGRIELMHLWILE